MTSSPESMPRLPLVDVDCNLWHKDLQSLFADSKGKSDDPWNILREDAIQEANIVAVLSPSSTIQEAQQGIEWMTTTPPPIPVKTTVGVHPYHVLDPELSEFSLDKNAERMVDLLQAHSDLCSAVGECGLDASEGFPPISEQIPWFEMQVKVAEKLQLPLFVHERLAFQETMEILNNVEVPILVHCFTGTKKQCQQYIDKGYYVSLSGYILKNSNDNCKEVLSCLTEGVIPLDRLMLETDAPYMGFPGSRNLYLERNAEQLTTLNGKKRKRLQQGQYPNVPSSLPQVLACVTKHLRVANPNLSLEEVATATTQNAQRFLGFASS
eukprot:Nitzschia sp. Nitz4//scaffold49_size126201//52301//53272//NITZ4_003639-RA/size126201-processed-gene-0.68-mRNA-1//1//CDS//3329553140//6448//frame0